MYVRGVCVMISTHPLSQLPQQGLIPFTDNEPFSFLNNEVDDPWPDLHNGEI